MRDLVRITFECKHCGGTVLTMEDDDPGVAIVRCKGCGRIKGTFNDLKSKAVQKSLDVILVKVRNALKK